MRRVLTLLLVLCSLGAVCAVAQADETYTDPPNYGNKTTTTTNSNNNNNLTQEMAKKTAAALKVFNNVNYKNMSDDKESFFDSDDNPYTDEGSQQKTFKIDHSDQ